jgi:pyrimidine operon attenuation protein/uracil phosphoribosyltransferase
MDIVLKSKDITQIVEKCAKWISDFPASDAPIAIIGIRSRGVFLAGRIAKVLEKKTAHEIPCGTLDITLYRDDLNDPHSTQQPQVRSTEIDFDITGKTIILVDDVLQTGRTIRAAMDAIMEFGRPQAIKLAVLIDRKGRELPIQPDFVGHHVEVSPKHKISVSFKESDDIDQVVIE